MSSLFLNINLVTGRHTDRQTHKQTNKQAKNLKMKRHRVELKAR